MKHTFLRILTVCLSLLALSTSAHGGFWKYTETKIETSPDSGVVKGDFVLFVSAGNGFAQRKVACPPQSQLKEDRGKSWSTIATWDKPPTVLVPAQELEIKVTIKTSQQSLSDQWQFQHSIRADMIPPQYFEQSKGRYGRREIAYTNISSANGPSGQREASGKWKVPQGTSKQTMFLEYFSGNDFSVLYLYQWVDSGKPPATGRVQLGDGRDEPTLEAAQPNSSDGEGRDSGARFTRLSGNVEVCPADKDPQDPNNWVLAKREMILHVNDYIKTGEDAEATIGFSDMSTFVMRSGSIVVLSAPTGNESKIKLVLGNIWMNVKAMFRDGSMIIEMNQAVTSIKGTTFELADNRNASVCRVSQGKVNFRCKKTGKSVDLTPGMTKTIANGTILDGDPHKLLRSAESNNPPQNAGGDPERSRSSITTADHAYQSGIKAYDNNEYAVARNWFEKTIELDPAFGEAYRKLGNTYLFTNQPEKAIHPFEQACKLMPDNAIAWNSLGCAFTNSRQLLKAIDCFTRAISIDPDISHTHFNLGVAYARINKPDEARACLERALNLQPQDQLAREIREEIGKLSRRKNESPQNDSSYTSNADTSVTVDEDHGSPRSQTVRRSLPGRYSWIGEQVLVLHPNGTMQALVNEQPINSGRWTVLDRAMRKYQLTWDGGGFVDIITADADFNTLRGNNNNGTPLIGKRKN